MDVFQLTPNHLWDEATYGARRHAIRRAMGSYRSERRVLLGPHVSLCFENVWTLWYQIQEMLAVEQGGASQALDELAAYNPLIPGFGQVTATLMIEIPDPEKRMQALKTYTHIEEQFQIQWGSVSFKGIPIDPEGRTREDGKTSSVHFLRFEEVAPRGDVSHEGEDVEIHCLHPAYRHGVVLTEVQKKGFLQDLHLAWKAPCPFDPSFALI